MGKTDEVVKCVNCFQPVPDDIDPKLKYIFGTMYCSWECERWDNMCPCCAVRDSDE